jgi:hypothetical protein
MKSGDEGPKSETLLGKLLSVPATGFEMFEDYYTDAAITPPWSLRLTDEQSAEVCPAGGCTAQRPHVVAIPSVRKWKRQGR